MTTSGLPPRDIQDGEWDEFDALLKHPTFEFDPDQVFPSTMHWTHVTPPKSPTAPPRPPASDGGGTKGPHAPPDFPDLTAAMKLTEQAMRGAAKALTDFAAVFPKKPWWRRVLGWPWR